MPISQLLQAMDPPCRRGRSQRPSRSAVPRLPDRRPRGARGVQVPRQLDLRPRPRGRGRADPELRLVVAVPGEGRPHLSRARVLRVRGRRDVDQVRRGPGRAGRARAGASAWSTRRRSRPATSCGCRRRIPFYDEHYKANVERIVEWLEDSRAERAPGRAQRHAPLQQPGPLDVHRDADGREHRHRRRPRRLER